MSATNLIIGVHLEQIHDRSAIVCLRRVETLEGDFDKTRQRWPTVVRYDLPVIIRPELGTRYPEIIGMVADLLGKLPQKPVLVVDVSVSGRPVIDRMVEIKLDPIPVHVSETTTPRAVKRAMIVPRRELVSCMSILLGERRLRVPKDHPEADTLARELSAFRMERERQDKPWSRPEHDDLVVSTALAAWWGENRIQSRVHQPPPPKIPPPPHRPPTFLEAFKTAQKQASGRNRI